MSRKITSKAPVENEFAHKEKNISVFKIYFPTKTSAFYWESWNSGQVLCLTPHLSHKVMMKHLNSDVSSEPSFLYEDTFPDVTWGCQVFLTLANTQGRYVRLIASGTYTSFRKPFWRLISFSYDGSSPVWLGSKSQCCSVSKRRRSYWEW